MARNRRILPLPATNRGVAHAKAIARFSVAGRSSVELPHRGNAVPPPKAIAQSPLAKPKALRYGESVAAVHELAQIALSRQLATL